MVARPTAYQRNDGSTVANASDECPPKSGRHDWAGCTALVADWPSTVRVTTPAAAGSEQWGLHVQMMAGGSGPPVKCRVNDDEPPLPDTFVYAGPDTGPIDAEPVTVTEQTWCGSAGNAGNSNPKVPSAPVTRGVPMWKPQDPPTVGRAAPATEPAPTEASVAPARSTAPTATGTRRLRPRRPEGCRPDA